MNGGAFSVEARRLARNFSWLTLQEIVVRLIGLATAIYLARTLSAEDYGALGVALSIVGFASTLALAGSGSRAARLTARNPAAVPLIFSQVTGLRLAFATGVLVLLAGFSGVIAPVFSLAPPLLVLCSLLLLPPAISVTWAFRGLDRMKVNAIADVAEKCLTFLGLLLLVHGTGRDVLWAPVAEVAAALLVAAWMYRRLRRLYPGLHLAFRMSDWSDGLRETAPLSLASLLGTFYFSGGVLLLGWLASATAAAQFLVAQKIMLTLALLLHVINNAAFPSTSRLVHDDPRAALLLATRLLRYYLVIIVPVFLLVAFHARGVLTLLFGPEYAEATTVLIILLAALPFLAVNNSLQLLLMALPRPMAVLVARIAGAAVLLSLSVLLIPRMQAAGAALALAAAAATSTGLLFMFVRRAMGGVPWNSGCYASLAAGAAAAMFYALAHSWPLLLKLPLAAMLYMTLTLALRAVSLAELRDLPLLLFGSARNGDSAEQAPGHAWVQSDAQEYRENQP